MQKTNAEANAEILQKLMRNLMQNLLQRLMHQLKKEIGDVTTYIIINLGYKKLMQLDNNIPPQ